MAIKNLPNYNNDAGFGLPLNIRRGNPNPLDNSYLWGSYEEAALYAATNPTAYVGQIIAAYEDVEMEEEDGSTEIVHTVCVYVIINEDGDLLLLGSIKSAKTLETNLDKIKEQIGEVQEKTDGIGDKVDKLEEDTGGIQDKIDKIEEDTGGIKDKVDKLEEDTGGIKDKVDKIEEDTGGLQDKVDKLEEDTGGIKDKVDKIEEDTGGLKDKIDEISTGTGGIKDNIGEVTDPDTGENNLPDDADSLVDAINKVNDKIVDPRDEDDQWATEEDIDNLYGDLFDDLGW